MTKQELVLEAKKICNDFPKNSSQIFQAFLKRIGLSNIVNECKNLSDNYNLPIAAGLYMYINDMSEPPKCIDCHNEVPRFLGFNKGFNQRCKKCGTIHSHILLAQTTTNKSEETRQKLRDANRRRAEEQKLIKQNYHYIELTQENIDKAYREAEECVNKGYTTFPMDNLKLNKIKREYPHLMEVVKSLIHENKVSKPLEGLYWMVHKLTESPHCQYHLDDKCIDKVTFINFDKGYHEACGQCCKHKPEARKKATITYKLKTGYDNPTKNPEVIKLRGDNYEKIHGTGIRHHMQLKEGQQKVVDAVRKLTDGKYDYMINVPEVHEKGQQVLRERKEEVQRKTIESYYENWGVDRYQSTDQFKNKLRSSIMNRIDHINQVKEDMVILKDLYHIQLLETPMFMQDDVNYQCCICGYKGKINISRVKSGNTWVCPICHPYHGNQSKGEYDVMCTIKYRIPEAKYEFSNRKILNGKEIDIYYPDYHLAIEYSGCRYHSNYMSPKWEKDCDTIIPEYHYNKWLQCRDNGIQLLTIFDDDWTIAKYRKIAIPALYGKFGVYDEIINIADCEIYPCYDKEIIYKFLSCNVLDRFNNYCNSYVVMNQNRFVAMLCFEDKDDHYDMRYCNVKSINILHGFEKLLEKFRKEHVKKPIEYSVNRDWNDCPNLSEFGFIVFNNDMNLNQFYWGKTLWKRKMIQDFNESNHEMLKQDELNYLFDCGNMIYRSIE